MVEAGNLDWATAHYADAYDLTINELHTYFVEAGDKEVLVHNTNSGAPCPPWLSDRNPLFDVPGGRHIREAYEQIRLGRASQRLNPDGSPDIFQGRKRGTSFWRGAEIYDVPGVHDARILRQVDDKGRVTMGYVTGHNYSAPKRFPSPWYPDGG